ncbi:MAG: hypothetical protein ACK4PR_05265, partial [Gammaproteobacteria bacterium]
ITLADPPPQSFFVIHKNNDHQPIQSALATINNAPNALQAKSTNAEIVTIPIAPAIQPTDEKIVPMLVESVIQPTNEKATADPDTPIIPPTAASEVTLDKQSETDIAVKNSNVVEPPKIQDQVNWSFFQGFRQTITNVSAALGMSSTIHYTPY